VKICIAFQNIGHYHTARINALADSHIIIAIEMSGVENGILAPSRDEKERFKKIILDSENAEIMRWQDLLAEIGAILDNEKPSVVFVHGYYFKTALALVYAARKRRIRTVLMSDSIKKANHKWPLLALIKKRIVLQYDAALVSGRLAKDCLVEIGFDGKSVFLGYDVVDNGFFRVKTDSKKYNFLFVGRFIFEKNLERLLRAYSVYVKHSVKPWGFSMVGDGDLKINLKRLAEILGISEKMDWLGSKNYQEMRTMYSDSNVLVLPSISETWGLVVNEAMASGLPVLVSNRCGCAEDLVHEGLNGYTFEPNDIDALARLFTCMAAKTEKEREIMGKESLKIVSGWGLTRFSEGATAAAECALACPLKPFTIWDKFILWTTAILRG
jgi:glycosyltransferase involved in cell wall biosynthesis